MEQQSSCDVPEPSEKSSRPSERKGIHEQKPQNWGSQFWASSLFWASGDMQDNQKRGGHLCLSFLPMVERTPVSKAPKVKHEVGADHGTAKHKTRNEVRGRPDSLCLSSSHNSHWAQLQKTNQLQTKCGLKRSSQVLGWNRQHLPSRDVKH